jgi:hypothetical protein
VTSSSATLRKKQADIEAFVDALNTFFGTLQAVHHWDSSTSYAPRPGMEVEGARLSFDVDRAAGRAAYAFDAAGSFVSWKPRGTMQTQPINPATAWATVVSDDPMFGLDVLMACCSQAIGILEMKVEAAEEEERNLPPRMRPRGAPCVRASRLVPMGQWAAGVLAAVLAAMIVAGVTYWLGWR